MALAGPGEGSREEEGGPDRLARKVNDLTRDLDNCNQDRLMYEMKRDMHSSELETLTTKLKSIDSDVATLRPQLELDSLKERCKCMTPWCWGGGEGGYC